MNKLVNKIKTNKIKFMFLAVFALISFITLATAILTKSLNINGTTKIAKNSWIIYFDEVRKSSDSVPSTKDAAIVDFGKTRIEFDANLKSIGDFYEFTVYTVNDGTIDAMVDSIEKTELTEEQQKYLDFKVTYDSGTEIRRCDTLNAKTRRRIKAIVKYKDGLDIDEYPTEDVNLNLYFNINYVQKDAACPPREPDDNKVLTIVPNGGVYQGRTDEIRIYMNKNDTYTLDTPTRNLYNFKDWNKNPTEGTYTIVGNTFTMGDEDVTLTADWQEGDYVARIMNTYYPTIQDALDAAAGEWEDNTVYLLKDTEEDPINNTSKRVKFNLSGHTVTGTFTNSAVGDLQIVNGIFLNEDDNETTFDNYGNLIMGQDDGEVYVDSSITILGEDIALKNHPDSTFYIYDGYLQAKHALVGGYTDKANGYIVIVDPKKDINKDRVYLVRQNNRAICKTTTNGVMYYYNLQSAINEVEGNKKFNPEYTDSDYIIYAIRDFEAAYELSVDDESRVFFDTSSYKIKLGENVTNEGYFKIYNSEDNISKLSVAKTITNKSTLDINNLTLEATADANIINNQGTLSIEKSTLHSKYGYAVSNTGAGTVNLDNDTLLSTDDNYGLYNSSTNLVINNGTIEGLYNTGTAVINGGTFNTILDKTQNTYYTRFTNGIYNEGTITMNGGIVHNTTVDTNAIVNRGTFNFNDGNLNSNRTLVQNNGGTFNVLDNEIVTENVVITNGIININGGSIESTNNKAITGGTTVIVTNGEVISDLDIAIDISGTVTVNGGTVNGKTKAINTGTFNLSSGNVISDGLGVATTTAIVSGGSITSVNNALNTNTLNMSAGTITSTEGTGTIINSSGIITGGTIKGDMYGVDSKGSITLGSNDQDVSVTTPILIGDSYGIYLEGNENNFYDGILKGQVDGYTGNDFNNLPVGYTVTDGEEEINGVHYETDYLSRKENWLRVGDTEYNTINDASAAIEENGTIYVIKDANINFIQEFTNTSTAKNIVFDLNGHTVTTNQNITNNTNISLTMTDSDPNKQGNITFKKNTGFINNGELIIDKGTYKSYVDYIFTNNSGMRIVDGKLITTKTAVRNNNNLSIEGGIIEAGTGVYNNGTTNMGGGEMTVTSYGIRNGTVTMTNGNIHSLNSGISDATIHIVSGEVHARDGYALYSNVGIIKVDDGNISSDNNTAIRGARHIIINNGQIVGKVGIENEAWYDGYRSHYEAITINDGNIHGTNGEGIIANGRGHNNRLEVNNGHISGTTYGIKNEIETIIYDGVVEGGSYGILNTNVLQLGRNNGSISTTNPVISGGDYGVYNNDSDYDTRFKFYDGVLKGTTAGHFALVTDMPNGSTIIDDYEYIERVEFKIEYLGEEGDFLRVGNKTFNSINDAAEYASEGDIIYVTRDANINFNQTFPSEKGLQFDLAGHSLVMTNNLEVNGNVSIMDSVGHGSINNLKEAGIKINSGGHLIIDQAVIMSENNEAIVNNGELEINDGLFRSNKQQKEAIVNNGTLVYNGGQTEGSIGLKNNGTAEINGGSIEGKSANAIRNVGTLKIYERANITSNVDTAIETSSGLLQVNGGNIVSASGLGVIASASGSVEINGGYIEGSSTGVRTNRPITITGGHVVGKNNIGLETSYSGEITGGLIEGATFGVQTSGTLTIGNDDGVVSIDEPTLKGELYGLYIVNNATVNFNDGILKGVTEAYSGEITNIPNRTEIFEDSEVIDTYTYKTAYLLSETDIAINTTTQEIYTNLQDALNECGNNETIKLLTNVPLFYEVTNNNNNNITLDLAGFRITTNKKFINNKNLTITNSTENDSFIRTSSDINLLTNTGTLNIDNVEVINNSSSKYVINNTSNLNMTDSVVTGLNGINTSGISSLNNIIVNTSYTGINNTNKMTIINGTIKGGNYSVYSSTNKEIVINGTTLNGTYYNQGGNSTTMTNAIVNSSVQNNGSTIISDNSEFNNSILNTGTFSLTNQSELNGRISSNSGTFNIVNSSINNTNDRTIITSGTLNINNSQVKVNSYYSDSRIIYNTGTVNISNNSLIQGGETEKNTNYMGIYNEGNANVLIEDSTIKISGNNIEYGIYNNSNTSNVVIKSGNIEVDGTTTYGAYLNKGTLVLGEEEEGPNAGTENADVSTTDPRIYSVGVNMGVGIKNINGSLDFYDGIIWGSRYAKPETTNNVELNYEVTTYVDIETGYEKAILEYMQNDYQGNQIAVLNEVYYESLRDAIAKCEEGDEILLLKSTTEDITIANNKNVKINLNGHSVTTKVTNNGTLNIYNGSLQNFDQNTVINNGTLIIGQDDGQVSSTSVRIVSETTAIINNGTVKMYDGYLQGVPSIEGQINEIPDLSRIYTEVTDQMERKYLQSLSREAIINKETNLIITIDPSKGIYNGSKDIQYEYLFYEDEYELLVPSKNGCRFIGWDVSDPTAISGSGTEQDPYVITIGLADITVTALWEVTDEAVAHIGNEYYTSVMEAINDAKDKDTIELIKNVTEDVTNNKNITIDLHENKITGEFINNGELRLINGTIENPDGTGLVNNKKLILGYNDGNVITDNVKIIGTDLGLEQNGAFNFYDGYIEGEVAFLGRTDSVPQGYFLYNERVGNKQRVYLIGNPANAVAVIEDGGTQYFFSLQDAINTATISGSEIFIVRNFEATYPISVEEGADILINMSSYNITTGNDITNNGTLKIYDTSEEKGSITSARTLNNYGDLTIEDVNITESNTNNNAIDNKEDASLTIKNSTITAQSGYSIYNAGNLSLEETFNLESTNFGLFNTETSSCEDIESGTIKGIVTYTDLTLGGTLEVIGNGQYDHTAIGVNNNATLTINGISITNTNNQSGIYNGTSANVIINEGTTINVNSGSGLYCDRGTSNYTMNGGTITSSGIGVRMQADNCNFNMNSGEINGYNYGIYTYGIGNEINVNGHVIASNGDGIRDDRQYNGRGKTININGGLVEGTRFGMYARGDTVTIQNAELKTSSINRDQYAYYSEDWNDLYLNDGAFLNAPGASGLRSEGGVFIEEGSRIYAGASNGFGIRGHYTRLIMNGGIIEAPGSSAYGILCNDNYYTNIDMNNGTIKSGYIGVSLNDGNSSYDRIFTMKSGSIQGDTYGLYITQPYTVTIGTTDDELSITDPYISGGLYGIYNTNGITYFYNGRLRGYTYGYNNDFSAIRSKKDIAEVTEQDESIIDHSSYYSETYSSTPTSNVSKSGNGYAKITYIGEDTDTCTNGDSWTFDYSGSEDSFSTPCTGKYKLEVWGAQGGSVDSSRYGGYGGYSTGEIDLNASEILFINVGGAGSTCTGRNCTVQGGYNGGGSSKAYAECDGGIKVGSGGGATHIATLSGLLSTLEDNQDTVLIVAGGGGGSDYCNSSNYAAGGSGGGYSGGNSVDLGAPDWDSNGGYIAIGGTQTSGYAFGLGQGIIDDKLNIGSGSGWYGGIASGINGAGGGSGYIGNSRLTSSSTYVYSNKQKNEWIVNYLVEKDMFLKVNDELFNSFEDASQYIYDFLNGEGTIEVIKDTTINESSSIVGDTTITLDLKGHNISVSKSILNFSNLTIVDTGDTKGLFTGTKDSVFRNNNNLTINGVKLKATGYNVVVGEIGTGSITITDSDLEGTRGLLLNSNQTVSINNSKITATADGIRSDAAATITIDNDTEIVSSDIAIRLQTDNNTLTINDGLIQGTNYGIYTYGQSTVINITGGSIISTRYDGIRDERSKSTSNWPQYASKFNITGGEISGPRYGMVASYCITNISDAEIRNTSSNNSNYAYYNGGWASLILNDGAFINAPNASAIWNTSSITINDGARIYAGHNNSYGIYSNYLSLTMNGGSIETPGSNAYGVYCANNEYKNIKMYGGTITSGYIGLGILASGGSGTDKSFNMINGSITGNKYGIYQAVDFNTSIGSTEDELSTLIPYVSGGDYAIYKLAGTTNFYNGRLRGKYYGYNSSFNGIRTGMDIIEDYEGEEEESTANIRTRSTDKVSNTAKAKNAKSGNGYARLTYIDETTSTCTNGYVWKFDYTGDEQTFSAPCAGKYKLEVWGAQGGSYSDMAYGGYGGYSTGEIELTLNENLYIYVGGQGISRTGTSIDPIPGGYNGGGTTAVKYSSTISAGSGGGATHIATTSGLLSSLSNNRESILIVAGGGGGSSYYNNGNYGYGGSGGGYKGQDGYSYLNSGVGTGGTQEGPGYNSNNSSIGLGSFGQGASEEYLYTGGYFYGAGGGGYYGGGMTYYTNANAGGGGSGYIGNSRLTNKVMYGYHVDGSNNRWIINYLNTKEAVFSVNGELFITLDEASEYIYNNLNGSGNITTLRDALISEESTVVGNTTITLDLAGYELTFTKPLNNNSNLTIVDSSISKSGSIINNYYSCINNKANLTINGVLLDASPNSQSAIYGQSGAGNIVITDSKLIGYRGILLESAQKVTLNNSEINATTDGIRTSANNSSVTINSGTNITASDIGIRLQSSSTTLTVNDGTITGSNYGIYTYGNANKVNINDGTIIGTQYDGIRDEYNGNEIEINVLGGTVSGARYGIYKYVSHLVVQNAEIKTTSINRDHYALYLSWGSTDIKDGAFINAPNASGIWAEDSLTMETGSRIYAGNTGAYGIAERWSQALNITGGSIETPGINAIGIYSYDNLLNLTYSNASIKSGHIGLYLNSSSNVARNVTINSGSIEGDTYGIYQVQNYVTTIGNSEEELSTSIPYISGGLYGIYNTDGTINFYNGRLRGYTYGYNNSIENIRDEKIIFEEAEEINNEDEIYTRSTTNYSSNPTSKTSKSGHGYVRFTYLGESNATCSSNETYNFDYTGGEQTFTPLCNGNYKVEAWGAQGGSYGRNGGYGGYSTGEIELSTTETLYINVGGQPTGTVGGYNGGGTGGSNYSARGGGGATHVATSSGILSSLENNKESIIIVAGGGGGSDYWNNGSDGGSGGGYKGANGNLRTSTSYAIQVPTGGTQTEGGTGGIGVCQGTSGTFGQGGSHCEQHGGGGGGGYYGGGGGAVVTNAVTSGAGGSGFINNSRLTNRSMYGYNIPISYGKWINNYLSDPKQFIINVDQDKTYSNIQKAFNEVEDGETLQMLDDAEIAYDVETKDNISFTLDMNGFNLNTTKQITNTTNLKIINTGVVDDDEDEDPIDPDTITEEISENEYTTNGLYLHYDSYNPGSSPSTVWRDISGNNNNANTTYATYDNNSYNFNGTNNYIPIKKFDETEFTWEAVFNTTDTSKQQVIAANFENGGCGLQVKDGKIEATCYIDNEYKRIRTNNINNNSIYTATLTLKNNTMKLYVDGVFVNEYNGSTYTTTTDNTILMLGANPGGTSADSEFLKGSIYSFKVYNKELTSEEIVNNYKYNSDEYGHTYSPVFKTYNYNYTGDYQVFTAPADGEYKLEAWGASTDDISKCTWYGCTPENEKRSKGAYTSGNIKLEKGDTLYIYVGSKGISGTNIDNVSIFNGGGSLTGSLSDGNNFTGGGASDIRLTNGNWNNSISLASRIMVAGGGGGVVYPVTTEGHAGALSSEASFGPLGDTIGGATQTSGGSFGIGQNGLRASGGGGYYGGKASSYTATGGSSYISGHLGSVAIASETSITPKTGCQDGTTDIECSYHYSGKKFNNTTMISGSDTMPTYDGQSTMDGNQGNGFVKITTLNVTSKLTNYEKSYSYTGNYQEFIAPVKGIYKIQTWGAAGGTSLCQGDPCTAGGKGGYSGGNITLNKGEKLYVYVGAKGGTGVVGQDTPSAYNGGGSATWDRNDDESAGAGGGATDIRLISGEWNNNSSLASRIMVAGGGGGASYNTSPGYGGGLTGGNNGNNSALGATQTSGYLFGIGKNGEGTGDSDGVAGGGGGYYGGESYDSNYESGSGGSGYVSGHLGSVAIESQNDTSPKTGCQDGTLNIECSYHYSGKVFDNTEMVAGNEEMPTFDNKGTMIGNTSDGFAFIKLLENKDSDNSETVKVDFDYTGNEEVFTAPVTGDYILEAWGASGNTPSASNVTYGYGGYSVGKIHLEEGNKLYINVGGQGVNGISSVSEGGYNGGGYGRDYSDGRGAGSGGGATHIATTSGLLNELENDIDSIIIVAGGGGGVGNYTGKFNTPMAAGSGGGIKGVDGNAGTWGSSYYLGYGGTQTEGGAVTSNDPYTGTAGTFGAGGYCSSTSGNCSGGGAGFYGGGSNTNYSGAGGGGSGYIGNSLLTDKKMVMYTEDTNLISDDIDTKTEITIDADSEPISNFAKEGPGHARITYSGKSSDNVQTTEYDYTGNEEVYTVPKTGKYKLETWGAQGGSADSTYIGGYGAYSTGTISLNEGDKLYINVGGAGDVTYNGRYDTVDGGYNGGGAVDQSFTLNTNATQYLASGGGATHIATSSGLLTSFENKTEDLIIVSAGGTGAHFVENGYDEGSGPTYSKASGASGAGYKAKFIPITEKNWNTSVYNCTESEIGTAGYCTYSGSTYSTAQFGVGADNSEGGGGGYYGGIVGGGSSGGISYIGNTSLTNKHTTCYDCYESNSENTKTVSTIRSSETPTADTAKVGDGYAKITYIDDSEPEQEQEDIILVTSDWTAVDESNYYSFIEPVTLQRSYSDTHAVKYYNNKISFTTEQTTNKTKYLEGSLTYWHDWSNTLTLGRIYVGLSTTNENRFDDYVSYTSYDINNDAGNKKTVDFDIPTPTNAGDYYFKIYIEHNTATQNFTVLSILNNLSIITKKSSEVITKPSKISNNLNTTLFINEGTLDIENVDFDSYNFVEGTEDSSLIIKNSTINSENKAINSSGTINIVKGSIIAPYGIETSNSLILNNGRIRSTNQAIINSGELNINDSNIIGNNYCIYDNSTHDSIITNSTLRSSSTAIHKQGVSLMTLTENNIVGNINNANASSTLNVNQGKVTGFISNSGTSTYTNVPINYTSASSGEEYLINNTGTLYMDESTVSFNNSYAAGANYYTSAVYNRGTLNSYKTSYSVKHNNGKYKWMLGIRNTGLLISNEDSIEISGAGASYAILNNSSNDSTITDMTINSHDNAGEIYAYRNQAGKLTINGGSVSMNNNNWSIMIYSTTSSNTIVTDTNMSSTNNLQTSYIVYMEDANTRLSLVRGTYHVDSQGIAYGSDMLNGNIYIDGSTFDVISGSSGYGINMANGNVNIDSGTINVDAVNAYGINMTNGTYTQGILDDSGYESADISITDPHIQAIGSTMGQAINMGSGTFNFYEGILIGSTKYKGDSDIVTRTPNSYQVKVGTDQSNNTYAILEYIK
ncbi:MAG: hypothetical protein J5970_04775 [Bacilli bacterium]|nr:hypothetical protein [Bacilli bacterium]